MLLNRRKIRTILNATDTTDDTKDVNDAALSFEMITADFFYIGFHGKFAARYFKLDTANTNPSNLTVEFWDGTVWTAISDLIDQTNGFTQSGFISWINETNWSTKEQTPITSNSGTDTKLYWIRISVSADLSVGTELQAVLNLFSDDTTVRPLYPELVQDDRYLPPGRTDFLSQHIEAKNRVIRRLIQKRVITEESQIIDINEVAEAAVHAFADIVYSPIAVSPESTLILIRAKDSFEDELSRVNLGEDSNKDGRVSDSERVPSFGTVIRS